MPARSYPDRTLKLLWGRAGGRCAMPDCRAELLADATAYDPIVVVGEIAHMAAAQDRGPRADQAMSAAQRNDYENLILLCQNCHAVIDGQPATFSVKRLNQIKSDHELWVRASLPERGRSVTGWTALALQGDHPVDLGTAVGALSPDFIAGELQTLQVPNNIDNWQLVDTKIALYVTKLMGGADPFDFRLAIFPLAPVSACLSLGFHLTNRLHLRLFQFHRDDHSWAWPRQEPPSQAIEVTGLEQDGPGCAEVVFVFHLSAVVADSAIAATSAAGARRIDIRVPEPETDWLQHPSQLKELMMITRRSFEAAVRRFPDATRWHLFYAGPAPAAVAVGQQINPTMCPPVQLYEFRMQEAPPYRISICLGARVT
jgi:hypothetical protein